VEEAVAGIARLRDKGWSEAEPTHKNERTNSRRTEIVVLEAIITRLKERTRHAQG
jgi:hypothetical protein